MHPNERVYAVSEMRRLANWTLFLLLAVGNAPWGDEVQVPNAPDHPGFVLPAFDGPNSVGVRSFSWLDEERSETGLPDGIGHREISVQIWYPATTGNKGRTALYSPGIEEMLAASAELPAVDRNFVMAHKPLLNTATTSMPGVDIAPPESAWSVILFSPGGNVSRHWQTALAERIASRGFVFVSISHPFSTIDVAPISGFSMSIDWRLDQEDEEAAALADNSLADILAEDAVFVLKQLRGLVEHDPAFAGAMNLDDAGIAGHSRGGKTVGRACSSYPVFKACAVIDNIGPTRERDTGIEMPFLTLRSPWPEERVAELHDYLGRTGTVAYDVELADTNHFTCTDLPLFIPDLRVAGTDSVDGIDICAAILSDFFDAYLRRRISADKRWMPSDQPNIAAFKRFQPGPPNPGGTP